MPSEIRLFITGIGTFKDFGSYGISDQKTMRKVDEGLRGINFSQNIVGNCTPNDHTVDGRNPANHLGCKKPCK